MSRVAWVLNLDADLELAASARGARYDATDAVRAAMAVHVGRLATSLFGPDDVAIDERTPPGSVRGLVGRAFSPTPRAIALLERAGAEPEPHPSLEVLREVNGRGFCASLGQTLPEAAFVRELDAAVTQLAGRPALAAEWRGKRAFGMAGRGQRVFAPGPVDPAGIAFLRAGIAEGGLQIEPNVTIDRELAVHGFVAPDGSTKLGRLVSQECDPHGQWLSSTPAGDVESAVASALVLEAERVAIALHAAGYFGPFGVDSFVYRDVGGAARVQPRSEINARYSMGFAAGLAAPSLLDVGRR